MHIRPATVEDATALAAFAARTFVETFAESNTPEDMQAHVARSYGVAQQTAELTEAGAVTLLAEQNGRLIGYAQLRRAAPPECVVAPDVIELHRFYAKCGFVDVGSHAFVLGADRQIDRIMIAPVPIR